MTSIEPPRWTESEFDDDRQRSTALFREQRITEPLEEYLEAFKISRDTIEILLRNTGDLRELIDSAVEVLSDAKLLTAARYLAGPPISADDLKILAVDVSLSPRRLRANPEMVQRIIDVILRSIDRQRFPWLSENREPSATERQAAIVATAALLAQRSTMTARANESKDEQELAIKERLRQADFTEVSRRLINNMSDAPAKGTFCSESTFATRKADIIARLYDGRIMPIEAKVSNSSTNSVKRLNNDAAAKASKWTLEFGTANIVPTAVLGGVFKTRNLIDAQDAGLTIFWGHNLHALVQFIDSTK